ncbi:hypothetical protein KGF57_000307 [Candida theae]|uniref:Mitochondrial thiamine pyrophosphate carrier 1 n=1 Tax=Candida theae TaxID=1198502 RepID=A0AAD5G0Y0_9ASCO|nr:uncharacterized protein KGF57_000307 [Candida theae]KAI5967613.1 hypothetical protein KGF57_000307 [Candida theae]
MSSNVHKDNQSIPAITGKLDVKHAIHIFPEQLQPFRSGILAYGASLASTLMGYPLDTMKVRMQTHSHFKGYIDCAKKTYSAEGLRGFFRGVWAPLISTSFSKSLNVSIYTFCKPQVYSAIFQNSWYGKVRQEHPFWRNIPVCFVSGCFAGAGVSVFACPFEFIKVYSQLEKLVTANSSLGSIKTRLGTPTTLQICKTIVTSSGLKGLYSGFKLHLLRDSLSTGVYFSLYESIKLFTNDLTNRNASTTSPFAVLLSGGLSGVLSWIIIFPVDTAKSLVQKAAVVNIFRKSHGLSQAPVDDTFKKKESWRYRGLGISVTRSFLTNMVFFGVFEFGMTYLA